jgi:hypothetical protein
MLSDPLDIIWRSADNPNPVFTAEELVGGPQVVTRLTELGVLRPASTATHVICDACDEHHVECVIPIKYPSGQTRFFIRCPENGRVEVSRDRLLQLAVDYTPLLAALAKALSAQEPIAEVVPRRVWNLGRVSLAGKSKPIWAARGLAWPDAGQIAASLPKGRSPILFFLGQAGDDGLLDVPRESIIEMRTVMSMNDDLVVDVQAVERQVSDVAVPSVTKKTKKQTQRDATVGALKRELHERILSLKSAIRHADDADKPFDLPRVTQKQLAEAIGVKPPAVSRAITKSGDLELRILLQTVESIDMVRKYSR